MILILTYHKVVASNADDAEDFYTITRDALESQLRTLQTRGYHCLSIDELLSNGAPPPNSCLLTFDDGTQDHYDIVLPLLQEHKFQGVFFVCTGKFDLPGYLTRAQVREIAQSGHIVACHAHYNRRLDRLTDEQIRERITLSRRIITEIVGTPPAMFAPPGGYINARVRAVVLANNMRIIRTMRWGYNDRLDLASLQCIPLNQRIGPRQFNDLLDRRRAVRLAVLYRMKEFAKGVLPSRLYYEIRQKITTIHRSK
ncbi:MAG: polysaccharide deacetylase family protein [Verrucomicrobiia bacterium]|jgi:peptidoglycan/xylan/chitin deacetylase (PgdA/CDA1 family)